MCISVQRGSTPTITPWNPSTRVITIPPGLSYIRSITAVRAVLVELAVPQPAAGAVCFCGARIRVLTLFPVQRSTEGARVAS